MLEIKIFILLLISSLLNLHVFCQTLKVGILTSKSFKYFVDADHDGVKNATGFSVDVFRTCILALPFKVQYELVPYTNGTYDKLIKKVYAKEIDAIMGDSTILANRSEFVDFTATYTDVGVGTLVKTNKNDKWFFLKPLEVKLWISIIGVGLVTWLVIWAVESVNQRAPQPFGATFWIVLMTLFMAQREELKSKLSRLVLFVWLLVILILITSYTATLSSLLTVEQFELASKGGTLGFHGGSFEAGLAGVTVSNLHFEDHRRKPFYSYQDYAVALTKGGKNGGADAIIDEIPYIKMFLSKYPTDYAMISSESSTSGFAFVFRKGSPLVKQMSRQIAKIREDGTLRMLEKKWFEKEFVSPQNQPKTTLNLGSFQVLFIICGSVAVFALFMSWLGSIPQVQVIIALFMPRILADAFFDDR